MGNIQLVIFDCDGVLVDSEPISNRLLADELTKAGLPTTYEEARTRYVGLSMASCMQLFEEQLGRPLPETWLENLQRKTFERLAADVQPVAGVEDLIQYVQDQGISTCVASSGGLDKISLTLTTTGLIRYFEPHVFSASMVARGKPHPDLFLHAAEQMKVTPAHTLVIEDSVPGVTAAKAAGMLPLAYAGDPHADEVALEDAGGTVIGLMSDAKPFLKKNG